MLESVVPTLGGKLAIVETLLAHLGYSTNSFRPIGQYTSKIHKKFILSKKYNFDCFLHFTFVFAWKKI